VIKAVLLYALAALSWTAARAQDCPQPASPYPTMLPLSNSVHLAERRLDRVSLIRQELAERSFDAIGLGDSIMIGWPPDLLGSAFGKDVLNAGIGGGSAFNLWLLQTADWNRQAPSRVLLMIGTNDLRQGACGAYWGIQALVARVKSLFPKATVVVISVLPRGPDHRQWEDEISQVNAELKAHAATAGYVFVDAHDAFLCNGVTPCRFFQPPAFLHLTRPGYELLTRIVTETIGRG